MSRCQNAPYTTSAPDTVSRTCPTTLFAPPGGMPSSNRPPQRRIAAVPSPGSRVCDGSRRPGFPKLIRPRLPSAPSFQRPDFPARRRTMESTDGLGWDGSREFGRLSSFACSRAGGIPQTISATPKRLTARHDAKPAMNQSNPDIAPQFNNVAPATPKP
jgi:hypothetical protein